MRTVVYNTCYGGFSLSKEACRRLVELGVEGANNDGSRHVCRHDPLVIQVVRELGNDADGDYANLSLVDVEGKYRIDKYDGSESVQEPDDIEWV